MTRKKVITRIVKLDDELSTCKSKCLCGHVVTMPVDQDKMLCTWCGRMIKNNSKSYFMYKLREAMKK